MAVTTTGGLAGYSTGGGGAVAIAGAPGGATPDQSTYRSPASSADDYWSLSKCKRAYSNFLGVKRAEVTEQQESRRYRHGAQWTSDQIKTFNLRKQPVVTFNRVGRKVDGIVGIIEKMRADPKAFPRTPRFQASADLATAALRSCLDQGKWKAKSPLCAESAAVDGIGGIELVLEQNPDGTKDVNFVTVDIDGFFYDPRSRKLDFEDATYMGMGKWVDVDVAKSAIPGHDDEIDGSAGYGYDLTSQSDFDATWFMAQGDLKSIRLVYICYRHKGGWCWALFTGSAKLMEGKSFFVDPKGKPICSFLMFSAAVDQDGDRYGFPRNLKSAQDEVNQRRSKGLHELNTRRLMIEKGAFDDIEKARQEAVKPDGVVERNKGYEAEFDDAKKQQDIAGQLRFLEDARAEIENFGPNPALLGDQGVSNRSGRALAMMQQAGIAELGPFVISHRSWKHRIYEALFCAIKKYWTNERWIRVSDDDGEQQLVQINAMQVNPQTGMPQMVNYLGDLDVDIMLDEGPDTVTMMEDMYETLSQVIPAIAPMLSPPEVRAVVSMLIETSPLASTIKKRFRDASQQAQQPDPMQEQAKQIELQGAAETVKETTSKTALNWAKAQQAGMPQQQPAPPPQPEFQLPPEIQVQQAVAGIHKTQADAMHKMALAGSEHRASQLEPFDYVQRAQDAEHGRAMGTADLMQRSAEFQHNRSYDIADLAIRRKQAERPRPQAGA